MDRTVVPPLIESPKSFVGVGNRELIILAVAGILTVSIFLLPISFTVRIGVGILTGGVGAAFAFGRNPKNGKPIEGYLSDIFRFSRRAKVMYRGVGDQETSHAKMPIRLSNPSAGTESLANTPMYPLVAAPEQMNSGAEQPAAVDIEPAVWFHVRPLPLTASLFFTIMGLAVLGMIISWVWLGGMRDLMLYMGIVY